MATGFEDFIQFAIEQEQAAAELYAKYSARVQDRATKEMLNSMAEMERGHETKLKSLKQSGTSTFPEPAKITDIQLSDFMTEPSLNEDSDIQDVFVFAMKAEQKAYELYTRLAQMEVDAGTKELFEFLAADEKKHKYDLETTYEDIFMKEN